MLVGTYCGKVSLGAGACAKGGKVSLGVLSRTYGGKPSSDSIFGTGGAQGGNFSVDSVAGEGEIVGGNVPVGFECVMPAEPRNA